MKCKGQPGHGSRFIEDTAAEKLVGCCLRILFHGVLG